MSLASQIASLTSTNVRSIPKRLGNSLVVVIGIAGVVVVLISVLAMAFGFRATIRGDGQGDRLILLTRGATTEDDSGLSKETVATVMNVPGIRHDHNKPMVSAEVVLAAPLARKRDSSDINVTLRGVGEQYFNIRPELKLVSGRIFHPGNQELLVGASAQAQFAGLDLGNQVRLQDGDWTVVGTFSGGNGSRESEVIADAQTVMSAYKLTDFNTMTVMLESADNVTSFKDILSQDPNLLLDVRTEPEYLVTASGRVDRMLRLVAYAIGSIMALGALFGALNSMHSAVASRTVEIATLRAMGFAPSAVSIAVLIEGILLALLGAAIGVAIAYTAFNGATISTLGGASWDSQLVYSLTITPAETAIAVLTAGTIGLLGGLMPALRAARLNIADALHET
jgi:putative ABC transport system permease protein